MVIIGSFLIGLVIGVIVSQAYDYFLLWLDNKMWVSCDPIRVTTTDGETVYNSKNFPRTIDEIKVVVPKDNDKEEIE